MQNLEQIRASAALDVAKKTTKAEVNKLPGLILGSGLLAATAFAKELNDRGQAKREGMKAAMDGVAVHLETRRIVKNCKDAAGLLERLANNDSATLQRATAESLAFLGYVKRFATKEGD